MKYLLRLALSLFQLGLILALFAVLGALLAGCGGGEEETGSDRAPHAPCWNRICQK